MVPISVFHKHDSCKEQNKSPSKISINEDRPLVFLKMPVDLRRMANKKELYTQYMVAF